MPKSVEGENDEALSEMESMAAGRLFSMRGKTAVVTGGGSGIGAMIAAGLVSNGATVIICSRKDTSAFATELSRRGPGAAHSLQVDLADVGSVDRFVAALAKHTDRVHCLVNNSGTNFAAPIDEYPPEAFDKVMKLNVRSVFDLTRRLLPLLEAGSTEGDPSRVINIASIEGLYFPAHETYAYSASKAAVIHMSRVLAGKLGRRGGGGITVNAILPGPFSSRMMRATLRAAGSKLVGESTALGRMGGPSDIAGCCLWLASRAGTFVTGSAVTVDGGASVRSVFAYSPKQKASL